MPTNEYDNLYYNYPRPHFIRKKYLMLDGQWNFKFEDENWKKINVPFVYQSKLSGINEDRICESITYNRNFKVPADWYGQNIILNFGAVDYISYVHINGHFCKYNEGGNTGFSVDITDLLNWTEEEITVVVHDFHYDETIPRGKQSFTEMPYGIWYTPSTGIWQSVFIEPVARNFIEEVKFTPDIDKGNVEIETIFSGRLSDHLIDITIYFKENQVYSGNFRLLEKTNFITLNIFNQKIFRTSYHDDGWCWSPENPNLFYVDIKLIENNQEVDFVRTYFGMRKVETKNGLFLLNNKPYYQKLVLDQGYFEDSLLTPPSLKALEDDIVMSKQMGFNGCRKHQKSEDPRFLYLADKLGYLVWSEVPSCPSFSFDAVKRITNEWFNMIKRDYNHPCIIAYVTINESWGVPNLLSNEKQLNHVKGLYHTVKSLDGTRLVVSNDGWEITKTDICAIHNYNHGATDEQDKGLHFEKTLRTKENLLKEMPAKHFIYLQNEDINDEPIMLTEFGGISLDTTNSQNWGYSVSDSTNDFIQNYKRIIQNIYNSEVIFGFCYTQLADVQQETNGLLTYDRKFKVKPEIIKNINDMWHKNNV